jgi:hypothetical protein
MMKKIGKRRIWGNAMWGALCFFISPMFIPKGVEK